MALPLYPSPICIEPSPSLSQNFWLTENMCKNTAPDTLNGKIIGNLNLPLLVQRSRKDSTNRHDDLHLLLLKGKEKRHHRIRPRLYGKKLVPGGRVFRLPELHYLTLIYIHEVMSSNCWFARDVTAAMVVVKNKSISLLWELNSIFM